MGDHPPCRLLGLRPSPEATHHAMEALKVSSRSNPNSVAGAMAGVLRREGVVEVTVVGAAALNQAMKAVAIARAHVIADGIDAVCIPSFVDVDIEGEMRTGIQLRIEHRPAPVLDLRDTVVAPPDRPLTSEA